MTMDDARIRAVFGELARCLESVVAGSGHLSAVSVSGFTITGERELEAGHVEYEWTGEVTIETEFAEEPRPGGGVTGTIVLGPDGQVALDAEGRPRVTPYRCLAPPRNWADHPPE